MTKFKIDQRSIKTRSSIKKALISLLPSKDHTKITIKELAETAKINRKTFYIHYNDIFDVFEDIENDITTDLLRIIKKYDHHELLDDPYPFLYSISKELNNNLQIGEYLVCNSYSVNLFTKIKNMFIEILKRIYSRGTKMKVTYSNTIIIFVVGGIVDTYEQWFKQKDRISLEELSTILSKIISSGTKIMK